MSHYPSFAFLGILRVGKFVFEHAPAQIITALPKSSLPLPNRPRQEQSCIRPCLDAPSHLYKRVCPSVRPSVGPSVPRYFQTRTRRILCRVSGLVFSAARDIKRGKQRPSNPDHLKVCQVGFFHESLFFVLSNVFVLF